MIVLELVKYTTSFDGVDLSICAECIIEDAVVIRRQTDLDPEEYGSALMKCRATFFEWDEPIPDKSEIIKLLEDDAIDWQPVT